MLNRTKPAHRARVTARIALVALTLSPVMLLAAASPAKAATAAPGLLAATLTTQGFGTIKGRLVWGGDTVPAVKVLKEKGKADKDPEVCAASVDIFSRELVVDPKTKGVAFGIAYIVRPKGKNPQAVKDLIAKKPELVLDQLNCEFSPFVLAMHTDQSLLLKSSDPVAHNVRMSGFANPGFNQNLPPKGSLAIKLKPERFPIQAACDIHPWMNSYVMVFDHPFFFVTGPDGVFELKGVPVGTQNLVVRQEKIGFVTPGKGSGIPVTVSPDQTTDVGDIKIDPSKVK